MPLPSARAAALPALFALAGLVGLLILFATTGWAPVLRAVARAGVGGVLLLGGAQALLTLPLALAWGAVCPGAGLATLAWARLVRDGVGSCLPFTAVGGLLVGARLLARPIGWPRAGAATAVDATLEFAAQLLFALIGALLLWRHLGAAAGGWPPVAVAAGVATVALLWRWPALARRIGHRRLGADGSALVVALDRLARAPGRLAAGTALHLVGWVGSGVATWLAFRLLGHPLPLAAALAIEALLCCARGIAFFVPAGLGVQEVVYVALGALYGVDAELSLGVSLLRRARELAVGVPAVVAWQLTEWRRLLPRPAVAR